MKKLKSGEGRQVQKSAGGRSGSVTSMLQSGISPTGIVLRLEFLNVLGHPKSDEILNKPQCWAPACSKRFSQAVPLESWGGEEAHRPSAVSGSCFSVSRPGRAWKKMEYYYLFVFTVTQSVVTGLKSTLRKGEQKTSC